MAFAQHVNDATAQQYLADPNGHLILTIFFILIAVLSIMPTAHCARAVRWRLGRNGKKPAVGQG